MAQMSPIATVNTTNPLAQLERHNMMYDPCPATNKSPERTRTFSSSSSIHNSTGSSPQHGRGIYSPPPLRTIPPSSTITSRPPLQGNLPKPFKSNFTSVLMSSTALSLPPDQGRQMAQFDPEMKLQQPIPSLPNHDMPLARPSNNGFGFDVMPPTRPRRQSSPSGLRRPPDMRLSAKPVKLWSCDDELTRRNSQRRRGYSEIQTPNYLRPITKSRVEPVDDIINVDEDVDLERMYLDLVSEEYTATVRR